ncbi:unnamed protein product [Dovyalis caffra]|uniref:Ribosomal protein L33 n=1 Tax=Dovyalis caffra TaxID=77055 RepID=A0AAV1QYR0_9ROSI|nr:unnamed protein product [Dovyalis caffra]
MAATASMKRRFKIVIVCSYCGKNGDTKDKCFRTGMGEAKLSTKFKTLHKFNKSRERQ